MSYVRTTCWGKADFVTPSGYYHTDAHSGTVTSCATSTHTHKKEMVWRISILKKRKRVTWDDGQEQTELSCFIVAFAWPRGASVISTVSNFHIQLRRKRLNLHQNWIGVKQNPVPTNNRTNWVSKKKMNSEMSGGGGGNGGGGREKRKKKGKVKKLEFKKKKG